MSWPPISTAPSFGSYIRETSAVIVVLPAPDGPTSAVSCPDGASNDTSWSTPAAASVRSGVFSAIDSSDASDTSAAVG